MKSKQVRSQAAAFSERGDWRKVAAAMVAGGVLALPGAAYARDDVQETLRKMNERLQQLEQRNQALEKEVKTLRQTGTVAAAPRVLPDNERLVRLEQQNQVLQEQVRELAHAPQPEPSVTEPGIEISASLVSVYQHANRNGIASGETGHAGNYRGDVEISIPAGHWGEAQGKAFAHVRFGQGNGLTLRDTHVGVPNSTTFEKYGGTNSDDSFAILAQAYYQLTWPLKPTGFNDQPGDRIELTLGKMDFFGFFDQNAVAGDEASQFLNNAFVHNPLLDTGGDIGADNYGFAPGARLGYYNEGDGLLGWGVSLGIFAAGNGARFDGRDNGGPLSVVQFELSPKQINGEPRGNYRIYAWNNGSTEDLEGNRQRHRGWGISVDQRLGRDWNLFARYGHRTSGEGAFDQALTGGFEFSGASWGRRHDAIGVGLGLLKTSQAQKLASGIGGNERLAEIYYRGKINEHLEISPHYQWISHPQGNSSVPDINVLGVRAALSF